MLVVKQSILVLLDIEAGMYDKSKDKVAVTKAKIVDPKSPAKQAVSDDKDSEVNKTSLYNIADMLHSCLGFSQLFFYKAHFTFNMWLKVSGKASISGLKDCLYREHLRYFRLYTTE